MPPNQLTDAERLRHIKAWFHRHRFDQCSRMGCTAMPNVWAEHVEWLISMLEVRISADAGDPQVIDTGKPSTRDKSSEF